MVKILRDKIIDVLKREDYGVTVNVKGWVRTRRGNKKICFIALNDGSTIKSVQIVADLEKFSEESLRKVTTGACLSVNGILVESPGQGQQAEIHATEIDVLGEADPATYPLQKKGHSLEYLREIAHLRPRTNTFGAIFRIRHHMSMAIH
ncbi:MAG: OB-fold nucleic acid binding domain-containing protein, partial [Bacteroidota bacterium]|nr:OB-fold nucleic acid binding domain-containing protein [Bacteroidota bacterium]